MKTYAESGLKFVHPKSLTVQGDMPTLALYSPDGGSLILSLYDRGEDFDMYYESQLNPEAVKNQFEGFFLVAEAVNSPTKFQNSFDSMFEIIRAGDYPKFPGAKELFAKLPSGTNFSTFNWDILIPLNDRVFRVSMTVEEKDFAEIEKTWAPIIESIELETETLCELEDSYQLQSYDWTELPEGDSGHFSYEFNPHFHNITFMDSTLLEDDPDSLEDAFFDLDESTTMLKIDRAAILFPISDPLLVKADFYFNTDAPSDLNEWAQVFESILAVSSGHLSITADVAPEIDITLEEGNYRLRVYFKPLEAPEDESWINNEQWAVYIYPATEEEDNTVNVIKKYSLE